MFQPTAKLTQAGPQSDTAIAFADRAGAVTGNNSSLAIVRGFCYTLYAIRQEVFAKMDCISPLSYRCSALFSVNINVDMVIINVYHNNMFNRMEEW